MNFLEGKQQGFAVTIIVLLFYEAKILLSVPRLNGRSADHGCCSIPLVADHGGFHRASEGQTTYLHQGGENRLSGFLSPAGRGGLSSHRVPKRVDIAMPLGQSAFKF